MKARLNNPIPDLLSIAQKGRPLMDCPNWYREGLKLADYAYETQAGWKLTERGKETLTA